MGPMSKTHPARVGTGQFGWLVLALHIHHAAALNFNTYGPCQGLQQHGASVPQCRRQPGVPASQQAVTVSAVPQQLAVDMRLPCEDADSQCHQNVDVVNIPLPPRESDITNCSYELMPWSPFPCTYDTNSSYGTPGQPTNLCYTAQEPGFSHSPARNLTTDGYSNVYFGVLPNSTCSGSSRIAKILLRLDFRLAAGRQFDRTYSFQIGRAVAAFGTCSEPSRLIKADKYWSVTVDVTYLQNYLQPGMDTRFSLANVLTNTYNVPIWAKATLDVYYQMVIPSRTVLADITEPTAATSGTESQITSNMLQPGGYTMLDSSSNSPTQSADVPTEVLPLSLPEATDFNSLVSISGTPDSPSIWPNATFQLPPSLSAAGTIYRAQLLVVPKANGCEEFWAMNPPASLTNSTCGGISTGDPYREVRVHIDGDLAGFYPIYYTMYTGGIDPRLWTAIVASYAYSLPVYTFDLGPWLGLLNTAVDPHSGNPHTVTIEILGATGSDWILATTLLIWRSSDPKQTVSALIDPWTAVLPDSRGGVDNRCDGTDVSEAGTCVSEVTDRILTAESMLKAGDIIWVSFVKYKLNRYSNVITFNNTDGTASWNQRTSHKAAWFTGIKDSSVPPYSAGRLKQDKRASGAKPQPPIACGRQLLNHHGQRGPLDVHVKPATSRKQVRRPGRMWDGRTGEKQFALTQNARHYDWANVGGQYDMAPYVFSFNETLQVPCVMATPEGLGIAPEAVVVTGRQTHYQQATMVNVYDTKKPACTVPTEPTHSVVLNHSVGASGSKSAPKKVCKAWSAACAFCSPSLLINDFSINDCQSLQRKADDIS